MTFKKYMGNRLHADCLTLKSKLVPPPPPPLPLKLVPLQVQDPMASGTASLVNAAK